MARARAKKAATPKAAPIVEEDYFRSDAAYLCMIMNRRTQFVRVIDFRAGPLPAKRLYIQTTCKERGMKKVITLVEKDEVSSWTKLGFVREGTVPGFYKRSDGHLCGCVIGDSAASVEVSSKDVKAADRLINKAKKLASDVPNEVNASIYELNEDDALNIRDEAWEAGEGLHGFDPFGRDAARRYYESQYEDHRPNFIACDFQDCFGHSMIEVLYSPQNFEEICCLVAGLRAAGDELTERGIVAAFAFGPADDLELSAAFWAAGYRKTGLLAQAIPVNGEHKNAILWTRKLANPTDN